MCWNSCTTSTQWEVLYLFKSKMYYCQAAYNVVQMTHRDKRTVSHRDKRTDSGELNRTMLLLF